MKVNNRDAKTISNTVAQTRANELEKNLKSGKADKASNADALGGSSKVNVSPEAQAFQKAKAIASKDTVDEAKVARIQKLIDEGKYKVDSAAVADRLVDEHLATGE